MPLPALRKGFDVFAVADDVKINRLGTRVFVKAADGQFKDADTVEANILLEILKELRKPKR